MVWPFGDRNPGAGKINYMQYMLFKGKEYLCEISAEDQKHAARLLENLVKALVVGKTIIQIDEAYDDLILNTIDEQSRVEQKFHLQLMNFFPFS